MNPGELRYRLVIERRTAVQSSSGDLEDRWVVFASRRAKLTRSLGSEPFGAQQQVGSTTVTFTMRYLDGVTQAMRISSGGKLFDIKSAIDMDGQKRELTVTCVQRAGEAER